MKLSTCHEGDTVTITKVNGTGGIRRRLLDMGFMKGTALTVIRYAPLRDPMEIIIRDTRISLRLSEASTIDVDIN